MDPINDNSAANTNPPRDPLFYVGALGLLIVMGIETLAVIGRHIGWPLLGAIEIIQAAILVAACAAMLSATLSNTHATVHLLTDRLSPTYKQLALRIASLLSGLLFIALCAATIWLASDFWHAHEESELMHISFRPLRAIAALTTGSIALVFLYRAFQWRGVAK